MWHRMVASVVFIAFIFAFTASNYIYFDSVQKQFLISLKKSL